MAVFPTNTIAWYREFFIGTRDSYDVLKISMSEPWRDAEDRWNCSICFEFQGKTTVTLAPGDDALNALFYGINMVRVQQEFYLRKYKELFLWPSTMTPVLGSVAEDTIMERNGFRRESWDELRRSDSTNETSTT